LLPPQTFVTAGKLLFLWEPLQHVSADHYTAAADDILTYALHDAI
jgi:hypothetical protein